MPVNETVAAGAYFRDVFVPSLVGRLSDIAYAPLNYQDMLWMSVPLVFTLVVMEFYFGFYRDEELGWNTAVGNSMVLLFVGIDLLRRLYGSVIFSLFSLEAIMGNSTPKTLLVLFILSQGVLMILLNFFHALPKRFAFMLAAPLPVNLLAYLSLVFVYAGIPVDFVSIFAGFIIFVVLLLVIDVVHMVEPHRRARKTNVEKIVGAVGSVVKRD